MYTFNQFTQFSPYALLILLVICTGCMQQVLLDNPSSDTYIVAVAGKEYVVEPDTGIFISLKKGVCNLAVTLPDGAYIKEFP